MPSKSWKFISLIMKCSETFFSIGNNSLIASEHLNATFSSLSIPISSFVICFVTTYNLNWIDSIVESLSTCNEYCNCDSFEAVKVKTRDELRVNVECWGFIDWFSFFVAKTLMRGGPH